VFVPACDIVLMVMLFVPMNTFTELLVGALLMVIVSVESRGEAETKTEDTLLNTEAVYVK
jgi:hypothetical protein